jgi:hypothetical protein
MNMPSSYRHILLNVRIIITVLTRCSQIRPFLPFFRFLSISRFSVFRVNAFSAIANKRTYSVVSLPTDQIPDRVKSVYTSKRLKRFRQTLLSMSIAFYSSLAHSRPFNKMCIINRRPRSGRISGRTFILISPFIRPAIISIYLRGLKPRF